MPPPSVIFVAGYDAARSGLLFIHVVASTQRVLLAWGAVCLLAIPLGIAMGWWGRFNRYINPIVELLRPIPPLAWILISILGFGIGLQQNIFIIMIGCFFPVLMKPFSVSAASIRSLSARLEIFAQVNSRFCVVLSCLPRCLTSSLARASALEWLGWCLWRLSLSPQPPGWDL